MGLYGSSGRPRRSGGRARPACGADVQCDGTDAGGGVDRSCGGGGTGYGVAQCLVDSGRDDDEIRVSRMCGARAGGGSIARLVRLGCADGQWDGHRVVQRWGLRQWGALHDGADCGWEDGETDPERGGGHGGDVSLLEGGDSVGELRANNDTADTTWDNLEDRDGSGWTAAAAVADDFESNTIDPARYAPDSQLFEGGVGDIHGRRATG